MLPCLLVMTIWIPQVCVDPMAQLYRQRGLYGLEAPYGELLRTGQLTVGACTIGFRKGADLIMPLEALERVVRLIVTSDPHPNVDAWLTTFLTTGCVHIEDLTVCRQEP